MARYYRAGGTPKQIKLLRRLRPVLFLVLVVVIGLIAWLAYDIYYQKNESETASDLSTPVSSTISSTVQTHTTPFFQFQSPLKWKAVANETREGNYVYRQTNGSLVEQELVIRINDSSQEASANTLTNRVLPVVMNTEGRFDTPVTTLDSCKKFVPKGTEKTQQVLTMNKVSFSCNPNFTGYKVVVGMQGGSDVMTLTRPSGDKAVYRIGYKNLTANPNARDIVSIIKTFEAR